MIIQNLKGFRDFLGAEARKRQYVKDTFSKVFESYGFEPLETPTLEYDEILTGKYGEEGEKLMYRFEDTGGRKVAMRYDQTVPTARFFAQYQNQLPIPFKRYQIPIPFKRYQIQNVWRAENTQKGRYREFIQCDIDTIGINTSLADAEIIATLASSYSTLGFKNIKILMNDRAVFEGLPMNAIITIDKLKKIGEDGVVDELVARNISKSREEAYNLLQSITKQQPTDRLVEIFATLEQVDIEKKSIVFEPTLARGLDYYTEMIFEIEIPEYPVGSVAGGGRYDELIGIFANKKIPAVGVAVGFDRTLEAMEALDLFPKELTQASAKVLVTVFNKELEEKSLELASRLRSKKINAELYLDPGAKMEKQLKYADSKGIPYAIILGPEEAEKNVVTLKDLQKRQQKQITVEVLLTLLK